MKKLTCMLMCICALTLINSCKEEHKEEKTEASTEVRGDHGAEKADLAMNDEFQCPMDCEDGKTYDQAGACPICKMDLKKIKTMDSDEHAHDDGETHENHDAEKSHDEDGH